MILQLDVGNTRAKWRLCQGGATLEFGSLLRSAGEILPTISQSPAAVWVSSVAGGSFEDALVDLVAERWGLSAWFARSEASACGVSNSYADPGRMGVDRWLAMLAAWSDAKRALCVVDAGSALTIDFVAADGRHRGGYILPGLEMMERALLSDTDGVRFSDAPRDCIEPGTSTEAAVFNGLQLSQLGAVELALERFGSDEALYFCGGNGETLQGLLGRGGVLAADLVLDGLALLAAERGQ